MTTTTKYTAKFTPQAWIDDNAITVDARGPCEWDVTKEVVDFETKHGSVPDDNTNDSDDLRDSKNAPAWIKNWDGPFFITITASQERWRRYTRSTAIPMSLRARPP